jgi:hypothetical protein
MSQNKMLDGLKLQSIFHPSDFSEASEVAFVQALKIALVTGAKLGCSMSMQVTVPNGKTSPGVRDTLVPDECDAREIPLSKVPPNLNVSNGCQL